MGDRPRCELPRRRRIAAAALAFWVLRSMWVSHPRSSCMCMPRVLMDFFLGLAECSVRVSLLCFSLSQLSASLSASSFGYSIYQAFVGVGG